MNNPNSSGHGFEIEIDLALATLDVKDHALFLAKVALKLGHQLESPSAVAKAITEARNEINC